MGHHRRGHVFGIIIIYTVYFVSLQCWVTLGRSEEDEVNEFFQCTIAMILLIKLKAMMNLFIKKKSITVY